MNDQRNSKQTPPQNGARDLRSDDDHASGEIQKKESPERRYDLEDRTFEFAKRTRAFIKTIEKTLANIEDARQLVRSSGSVGANYIEANEALGRKDFFCRIKICRKEAKESRYWLRLLDVDQGAARERDILVEEAQQLLNIFGAIVRNAA